MKNTKRKFGKKQVGLVGAGIIGISALASIPVYAAPAPGDVQTLESSRDFSLEKRMEIGDKVKIGIYNWTVVGIESNGDTILMTDDVTDLTKAFSPNDNIVQLASQVNKVFPDAKDRDKIQSRTQDAKGYRGVSKPTSSKLILPTYAMWNSFKADIPLVSDNWILNEWDYGKPGQFTDTRWSSYIKPDGTRVDSKYNMSNMSNHVETINKSPDGSAKIRPMIAISSDNSFINQDGEIVDLITKAPTTATATVQSKNKVKVEWNAGQDVTGYTVERNGVIVYQGTDLSFVDDVYSGSDYTYDVYANYHDVYKKFGKATATAKTEAIENKDNVKPMAVGDIVYYNNKEYEITESNHPSGITKGKSTADNKTIVSIKAEDAYQYEDGKSTQVPLRDAKDVKAIKSGKDARVSWTKDPNAVGYEINRTGWDAPIVVAGNLNTYDEKDINTKFDYEYTVKAVYPGGLKSAGVTVSTEDIGGDVGDGSGGGGNTTIIINNNWWFGNTDHEYIGGKPTVTVAAGETGSKVVLDGFQWVIERTEVNTELGKMVLTPNAQGGTTVTFPDGVGNPGEEKQIKIEFAGQHFMTVNVKPAPELDFSFDI